MKIGSNINTPMPTKSFANNDVSNATPVPESAEPKAEEALETSAQERAETGVAPAATPSAKTGGIDIKA